MPPQVALGILQRIGFSDIVCAADGVKAIAEITARGGGEAFDIILTDLHMPRKVGAARSHGGRMFQQVITQGMKHNSLSCALM